MIGIIITILMVGAFFILFFKPSYTIKDDRKRKRKRKRKFRKRNLRMLDTSRIPDWIRTELCLRRATWALLWRIRPWRMTVGSAVRPS